MNTRWLFPFAFVFLVACSQTPQPGAIRPVKAMQVEESTVGSGTIAFPGTLRAFRRADLSFRVDGVVMRRDIYVGQEVQEGELLIQLDPRDYEVAVQKAQGKVASTQAQLDFAARDYERMQKIYEADPGAISLSLLDRKMENRNQLRAELEVATSDLDKANDDLSYTSLKAPFDGVIAAIYVELHEQVQAKQTVVRLLDTAEAEMEINVPEKYMSALLAGKMHLRFEVRLDAFPQRIFSAFVKEIGTEASSTTQTYPVTLTLHDIPHELSLLAGMSGRAIVVQRRPVQSAVEVYKVPKSAIFSDNLNRNYVWVIEPTSETVSQREVQLQESKKGDFVLIESGLKSGEWIVIAGTSFLSEGQHVKLMKESPAS